MKFSGKLLYANDVPAKGLAVRVFDKDADGGGDDDLTVAPGKTDPQGRFTVEYRPSRYLDWARGDEAETPGMVEVTSPDRHSLMADILDIYRPYLDFELTYDGVQVHHTAYMVPFVHTFRLPHAMVPKKPFEPSTHGFKFVNCFKTESLPVSIASIQKLIELPDFYGLCGGMASAACDYYLSGRTVPKRTNVPDRKGMLHDYLVRRQVDTFGALGRYVVKFCAWMGLPDDGTNGTQKRSYDQFIKIRERLDQGIPVVLGLVYVRAADSLKVWENHQVLAHEYGKVGSDGFRIKIYDPNHPEEDGVAIEAKINDLGPHGGPPILGAHGPVYGLECEQTIDGNKVEDVRGFFAMPYTHITPPSGMR